MKRCIAVNIFFIFFLLGHYASGEVEEVRPKSLGIEVGFETSHITYKEPHVMEEKGVMYGGRLNVTYRGWIPPSPLEIDKYMVRLEARGSFGEVDYTSPSSGSVDNIDDYMLEFRGLVGYDFYPWEGFIFTPYLGYGYRYLNDDMKGKISTTGAHGYEREIRYLYFPIGIETAKSFDNGWHVKLILEYDYFLDGDVKSHLGNVPGYYDIENDQDSGHGYRGSIRFEKKGESINFVIEPFARYWSIRESKQAKDPLGVIWIEPKNNSKEFGINFAVGY